MNSDRQIAIKLMRKAFRDYERYEELLQERDNMKSFSLRLSTLSNARTVLRMADEAAREAERFFRRIPGHTQSWSNIYK